MYIDKTFDDNEKFRILNEKWVSPTNFSFPIVAGRKYNPQWESEYPWLHYSVTKNAAYCVYCILFGNKLGMVFQHSGFTDWKNAKGSKHGALPFHEASESHKAAAIKALAFKSVHIN